MLFVCACVVEFACLTCISSRPSNAYNTNTADTMTSPSRVLYEECVNRMHYLRQKKRVRNSFHTCRECGNTFTRKWNYLRHKRHTHDKKMCFVCHCGKQYSRKDSLSRHLREVHPTALHYDVVYKSVSVPYDAASDSTQTQDDYEDVTPSAKQVLLTIRINNAVNTGIQTA